MKALIQALAISITIGISHAAPQNLDSNNLAIQGYDPVAYFNPGVPTKGEPKFAASHQGATYHFSSSQNLRSFEKNPQKYLPAFGGYCAYGVTKSKLIKIDPKVFQIHDGRLLLQVNRKFAKVFAANTSTNLATADQNWITLSK